MSSDRDRIAAECFRKGTEAMNKQNWDYAIDMFTKSAMLVPDNLMFRQTRHGCIRKKYDDNGSGAKMSKMKLMKPKGRIKKGRGKEDWEAVDQAAEEGLAINPWDADLLLALGDSCREREISSIAQYAYEKAVEAAPDSIPHLKVLAQFAREKGEFQIARACFSRIHQLDPDDSEARSAINKLAAESMLVRGGLEDAKSTEDVKKEPVNAYEADRQARKQGMAQAVDGPGQSEEADMQRQIRKEPENVNHYLKLADFYRNKKRLKEALDTYTKAIETCGENQNTREQLEDVELDMLRNKVGLIRDELGKSPDSNSLKEQAAKFGKELVKREIEVLASRTVRYPNDLRLKFELAQRYVRVKQYPKAIPLFQQAGADSRIKEDALVGLGECFIKDKKLDLGRRQFEKALQSIDVNDKPELYKTAHYWLGRLYEKAGKNEKAENHYTEILAADYEYKDVLKRLEELQGGEDDEFGDGEGLD